ncbi:MAG: threonine aldolase family protein [Acidimicrobiales bacterium]
MPTQKKPAPSRPTRRAPSPFSRDLELERIADGCERFVHGAGRRKARDLLGTIPPETAIDYYGTGGVVEELESEVARVLGKEAALFLPTGTMAQQATLRVHADRRSRKAVAFHPACHLESHEERGYERLHGLFGVPVGSRSAPLSAADLEQVHEPLAALLIELPQRDLGGTLPMWEDLVAQVAWARERGAAVHLDGARIFEAVPYYATTCKKKLSDIAQLFDTVYVSFYKGLAGLAGSSVAGDADVISELSIWRTRHGGRVFAMWPYAASALTVLHERLPKMSRYYRHAVAIAKALQGAPGVEVLPCPVQAPMMHLRLKVTVEELRARAIEIAESDRVWTFSRPFVSEGSHLQRCELSVGDATLEISAAEMRSIIGRLVPG